MNKMQRRIAAGLLVLGVTGFSGVAQAAEKDDVYGHHVRSESVMTGVDNPCTPQFDDITLNASWLSVLTRWDEGNGEWRSNFHVTTHLSGTAADGTAYIGNDQFKAQDRVEDGVVSITSYDTVNLVSQGGAPNFQLRYKVHVTFELNGPNGTFEVIRDVAECRG